MNTKGRVSSTVYQMPALFLVVIFSTLQISHAQMTLTPYGVSKGFTLTTFMTGFNQPNSTLPDPLGTAFIPPGFGPFVPPAGLLISASDNPTVVYSFAQDVDFQPVGRALGSVSYAVANGLGQLPCGQAGELPCLTQQNAECDGIPYRFFLATGAALVDIDCTGATLSGGLNVAVTGALGVVPFPPGVNNPTYNNHIFVSENMPGSEIWDVDVAAASVSRLVPTNTVVAPDGVSIDPTGTTLYAASRINGEGGTGEVVGINLATKLVSFTSQSFGTGVDGLAVGLGVLDGNAYVNDNHGSVWEVNLTSGAFMQIAMGGTRGDFIAVDIARGNSHYLLTQSNTILDLVAPSNGQFFGCPAASVGFIGVVVPTPTLPEWAAIVMAFGLVTFSIWQIRRRKASLAP